MKNAWLAALACGLLAIGAAGCGGDDDDSATAGGGGDLSGPVTIDGSSTVFPFAQAAAEGFQGENSGVKVTVGESGTGGGFEKFCAGETDIANASRPIDEEEEVPLCKKNGIQYSEVQVANDGIAVVSNPELKIGCLTTDQLKSLWKKGSSVTNYDQLGDGVPSGKVSLYGPGTDSGTFDFFTEEINGEKGDTRTDYQPSEDDNVLVQGVAGDKTALGYFGFSYYEDNQDKLNLIAVDSGDGCVKPSKETIQNGTYKPLSRPIFMYPSTKSIDSKPQVQGFMDYTVDNAVEIADTANIVPMTDAQLTEAKAKVPGTSSN
jgi:phosphate transport system substrate-binding protein